MLSLGEVERRSGHRAAALAQLGPALTSLHELQYSEGVAAALDLLAAVAADEGEHEQAAALLGAAEAVYTRMGAPVPPLDDRPVDPSTVRHALGGQRYEHAHARGAALDAADAVELGLAVTSD